jgi:hypothetical protein
MISMHVRCARGEPVPEVMHDLLAKFFETPSAAHYLAVRDVVRHEISFASFAIRLAEVAEKMAACDYAGARDLISQMMPAAALSPRVHLWSAIAAAELGDQDGAELGRFLYQTCLQGLEATGNGTARQPYVVTYPSDGHDLLSARGAQSIRQRLVEKKDQRYDVISSDDGTSTWFDVTDLIVGSPQLVVARPVPARRTKTTNRSRRSPAAARASRSVGLKNGRKTGLKSRAKRRPSSATKTAAARRRG